MGLYEIFSNRVKDLCSAVCHKLHKDPTLQNESYIQSISALWINVEMVIADAKQSNSDGDHWHEAYIGPSSSSFSIEQETSPLDSIVDDSAADGISQRYEGFLLHTLVAQVERTGC
jgi:hypothetical protein